MKICYIVAMEAEAQPFVEKFGVQALAVSIPAISAIPAINPKPTTA